MALKNFKSLHEVYFHKLYTHFNEANAIYFIISSDLKTNTYQHENIRNKIGNLTKQNEYFINLQ